MNYYQILLCENPNCGFRFPTALTEEKRIRCPHCGAMTHEVHRKSNPLEKEAPSDAFHHTHRINALLDNIRSVYNVGAIMRTADGAGLRHLFLCGITPTPEHPRFDKCALGGQETISWSKHLNAIDTAEKIHEEGGYIIALEEGEADTSLFSLEALPEAKAYTLIVGNELMGIDPGLLALSDQIISIPMQGIKRSLNVSVAFGIAAYFIQYIFNRTRIEISHEV